METFESTKKELEERFLSWDKNPEIRPIDQFGNGVQGIIEGDFVGTPFAFEPRFSFRSGEVTIWAAQNGHGKSLFTGQVAMQFALEGVNVCICSFEMLPRWTVYRMLRQWTGGEPAAKDIEPFFDRFCKNIFLLDHVGVITQEEVMGACIVAAEKFNCKHIFIDNLMKIVSGEIGDKALAEQKTLVQRLVEIAHGFDIHIHLIHHVRKPADEKAKISRYDLKGTGSISDQADNIILIQRNNNKEEMLEQGTLNDSADAAEGDVTITIAKQRNGFFSGGKSIPLWVDKESWGYCKDPGRIPLFPHRFDKQEPSGSALDELSSSSPFSYGEGGPLDGF